MEEFKNLGHKWLPDHTEGTICSIVAVSRATIIEKHFTLNKKLKGPDHKASMDFKELTFKC